MSSYVDYDFDDLNLDDVRSLPDSRDMFHTSPSAAEPFSASPVEEELQVEFGFTSKKDKKKKSKLVL